MKFEDYTEFYREVIEKYINELSAFDKSYHALTKNEKAYKKIYYFYEKKRMEIRMDYMLDSSKPIDRHKTAASMMYAILRAKVFKINYRIQNLPEPLRIANEYLAFYVAINIVELYKRRDDLQNKGINDSKYLLSIPDTKYEGVFNLYTKQAGASFISSICLTLANIKKLKYFDLFSYATILFLLENNTDEIIAKDEIIADLMGRLDMN